MARLAALARAAARRLLDARNAKSAGSALLLVAAFTLDGCSKTVALDEVRTKDRKVLLIGVDGMNFGLIESMFQQRQLPKLAELRSHGLAIPLIGELATKEPFSIGADFAQSWTTIATGLPVHAEKSDKGPASGANGVRMEMVAVKNGYEPLPVTSAHWEAPALWHVLGAAGVKSAIVNWFGTWPAEPVNGFLVTDRFFLERFGLGPFGPAGHPDLQGVPESYRHGASDLTWPLELDASLAAELKPSVERPKPAELLVALRQLRAGARDAATVHDLLELEQAVRSDVATKDTLVALLKRDPAVRFGACRFDSFDVAVHLFLMHISPQQWLQAKDPSMRAKLPVDYERYRDLIPRTAVTIDALVREVCDAMHTAGGDPTVLIVTDHTLEPDVDVANRDFNLNPLLRELGLLVTKPDGSIDWSKSECFDRTDWPRLYVRRLCVNFQGEWPQGFVPKGSSIERAAAWHRIHARLKEVKLADPAKYKLPDGHTSQDLIFDIQEGPVDSHFSVFQALTSDMRIVVPKASGPPKTMTADELFPPRHTSGRHAAHVTSSNAIDPEPGMLLVSLPGEVGERVGRRGIPMGTGAAKGQYVAPLVLALFGIPPSSQPGETIAKPDGLFWMLDLPDAQEMVLAPRVDSYERVIRFKDAASPLGARRALVRQQVEALGWTFDQGRDEGGSDGG
jgi:hypothetical protein